MNLSELYNTPNDEWEDDDEHSRTSSFAPLQRAITKQRKDPNHKYLGNGSYAYVGTNDDENFGDVHRLSEPEDGGAVYLNYIATHPELHDNPFAPKVRSIKKNKSTQIVVMERLIPFDTPAIIDNELLMQSICKRYFTGLKELSLPFRPGMAEQLITNVIHRAILVNNTEYIKDKYLRQLIEAIASICAGNSMFDPDTHSGNLMWRPHPYQPQLVITDPIA